jgi:hypothetical protein
MKKITLLFIFSLIFVAYAIVEEPVLENMHM